MPESNTTVLLVSELTDEEVGAMRSLTTNEGWPVFLKLISEFRQKEIDSVMAVTVKDSADWFRAQGVCSLCDPLSNLSIEVQAALEEIDARKKAEAEAEKEKEI